MFPFFPPFGSGNGFPYTNFHDLNMDWIVAVVKDFLTKYTNIESVIAKGLSDITTLTNNSEQSLETKTNELIATITNAFASGLADALTQFSTGADARAQQAINTIPSDYSEFYANATTYKGALEESTDFNNIKTTSIYGIAGGRQYTNKPNVYSGFLFTVQYQPDFVIQIALEFDGSNIWSRSCLAGTWSAWTIANSANNLVNYGILDNNSDFNNIKKNSIYALGSSRVYLNSPISESGWLITLKFQNDIFTQKAISLNGQEEYDRYFLSGTWSAWISQKAYNNHYYAFGDSITYGQIAGGYQSAYNYPASVGKLLKMKTHNYAVRGQGLLKDWDTIQTDFVQNLNMDNANLITINWAYNDIPYYSSIAFGNANSTDLNSFIGKYYNIMKDFQTKCPSAKIVLITGYGHPNGTIAPTVTKPTLTDQFSHQYAFSDGLHSIAEMYDTLEQMCFNNGWSCINQHKGTVVNRFNTNTMFLDQIHFTDTGYKTYSQYLSGKISSMFSNVGI